MCSKNEQQQKKIFNQDVLEPVITTASIFSRPGYSCAVTTSNALSSRSFFGDRPMSPAAVSSKVVKIPSYLPNFSTMAGGGVSHSRIAIRNGVFMFV